MRRRQNYGWYDKNFKAKETNPVCRKRQAHTRKGKGPFKLKGGEDFEKRGRGQELAIESRESGSSGEEASSCWFRFSNEIEIKQSQILRKYVLIL